MKRIVIFSFGIALLTACSDRLPTESDAAAHEANVQTASLADQRADAFGAIDDALERIVPALSDAVAAQALAAALSVLRTAMTSADADGLPALIAAARGALDRYDRAGVDQADVDAIRLALDYAEQAAR